MGHPSADRVRCKNPSIRAEARQPKPVARSHPLWRSGPAKAALTATRNPLKDGASRRVLFEALEPRFLLSADLMPMAVDMAADGGDLTLQYDADAGLLRVLDNRDGGVMAQQALVDTESVVIRGGAGDDRLVLDLPPALQLPGGILFDGGDGTDVLVGSAADSRWTIDGTGGGALGGLTFTGLENLSGAADNQDTFVFTATGRLAGLADGGDGGFDALELSDGTFDTVAFTVTGPQSGIIERDGDRITYAGLEPTTDATTGAKIVNGSAGIDEIIVRDDGTAGDGTFVVEINPGEDVTFTNATSLQINAGGDDDTVTLQTVDGAFTTAIGVDGGSGNDLLDASAFAGDADLGGAGGDDELRGGSGDNALTGGIGDDTYVFGAGFGQDTVTEAAGGGVDVLDFTGVASALTVSGDKLTITSGVNQLTQSDTAAEVLDITLLDGAKTALEDGLGEIRDFVARMQTGAEAIQQFANQLPLLDRAGAGSLGAILGLEALFDELDSQIDAAIGTIADNTPTLQELIAALNGITPGSSFVDFDPDYRGAGGGTGTLEALIRAEFATSANQTFDLDAGEDAAAAGIQLDLDVAVSATLDGLFVAGLTTTGTPSFFLVPTAAGEDFLNVAVNATVSSPTDVALDVGLLGLTLSPGMYVTFDGTAQIDLNNVGGDGTISVTELQTAAVTGPGGLITVSETSTFSGSVSATVDSGVALAGGSSLASATLAFSIAGSIFGTSGEPADVSVALTSGGTDLLDFGNLSPTELMGMLGQVVDAYALLADSDVLDAPVPFTGKTLGSLLDVAAAFKAEVLDPLFVSGDALRPDDDGDGSMDLTIGNIQELLSALGLDPAEYNPVNKELAFAIGFQRAFGFGTATVAQKTRGGGGANEVQTVTLNAVDSSLADTFRLGFIGDDGLIEFTDPIARDATQAQVKAALEALPGIGAGDVSVVEDTNDAGQTVYAVTFEGALANTDVALMESDASELAGVFPLDFGVSLGSLAGISTSGAFGITASVGGDLTFVVDLTPSQDLSITPAVFEPGARIDIQTLQDGSATQQEIQQVRVVNATAGSFSLIVGDSETAALAHDATATQVETALSGIGYTATVAHAFDSATSTRTYTITFTAPAGTNIPDLTANAEPAGGTALTGATDDGVLTRDAQFSVSLFNRPTIAVTTDTEGAAGIDEVQKVRILNADGGSFRLAFGGAETADLAYGSGAAAVQSELEGLAGIGAGNVSVAKSGDVYTVTFLGLGDVAELGAVAAGLSNATAALTLNNVTVADDPANTTIDDLAADVQRQIDAALVANGASLGFDADTATPGVLETALILDGGAAFVAAAAPFSTLPGDLRLSMTLADTGEVVNTRLRVAAVEASSLATALESAVNDALASAGRGDVTIAVALSGGKLEISATGADLRIATPSLIIAEAGGGRIALNAPSAQHSFDVLEPGATVDRLLQISADYDDPAFQELGLMSAPTPFDGVLDDDVEFTLLVNGDAVPVSLSALSTAGNGSIDDLVSQLGSAVDTAMTGAGYDAADVDVVRLDPKGNRIAIVAVQGEGVESFAIVVPDTVSGGGANGAVTGLGLAAGTSETLRAKATGFFIEDAGITGTLDMSLPGGASVDAHIGFLGVTASVAAGGSLGTDIFFSGTATLALKDPLDGDDRLTVALMTEALGAGFVLFDAGAVNPAVINTGVLAGTLTAGLDLVLDIEPAGGVAGLTSLDAQLSISIASGTDWLAGPPVPSIALTGSSVALLDQFGDLSFDDVIAALRAVVDVLAGIADGDGLASDLLNQPLPMVNASLADILDVAQELGARLDAIAADPAASIQELDALLRDVFGIGTQVLSFDALANTVDINLELAAGGDLVRPFSLDLADAGLPGFVTDLVGVGASGNLLLNANAALALRMGIDLGARSVFMRTGTNTGTNTGTGLALSASASASDLDFNAQVGPFGLFVIDGTADLAAAFGLHFVDNDADDRLVLVDFDDGADTDALSEFLAGATASLSYSGGVTLPLYVGTADDPIAIDFADGNPGDDNALIVAIDSTASPVLSFTVPTAVTDFFDNLTLPSIFSLLSDPAVIVDGLDRLLSTLQDTLNGQIFGIELPLVGDALADNPASNFIEDFRLDLLQPMADTIRTSNLDLDGLVDLITDEIGDVLGGAGGILEDLSGDGIRDGEDVLFRYLDDAGNEVNALLAQAIQFDLDISREYTFTAPEVVFDLGIPALGLAAAFTPRVTMAFNIHIGFGVDSTKGFYIVADYDDPSNGAGLDPEVSANLTIDFTDDANNPAEVTGRLLFLALNMTDGVDMDDDGSLELNSGPVTDTAAEEFSKLFLQAVIDIVEPGGDGDLTIGELTSASPLDTFQATISGGALLRVHGVVDFSTIDASLANVLPKVSTDILVDFVISASPGEKIEVAAPELVLKDITLDLGSFISGFAGPILEQIGNVIDPFDFLIGPDGFLNKRIPLLSDLAGTTITGKDLIAAFDPQNGPKVVAFLDFVEQLFFLRDLVRSAASDAGSLGLNFGDLVLFDDPSAGTDFSGVVDDPINLALPGGITDLRKLQSLKNAQLPGSLSGPTQTGSGGGSTTSRFTAGVTDPASLYFPILEPSEVFKLFLGQPATFFQVELPELGFNFFYRQQFPIFGPLVGTFGGGVGGGIDIGFGYDSLGLQQFLASENPATLVNGFFISDLDPVTGFDRPEAFLTAQITVGAALSVGVASAGVEGGIQADILFNMSDLDLDGKVRLDEMAANLLANDYNPLAVFDINGLLQFFMRAYLEINLAITKIRKDFEFARLTLFEFDIPFDRPAIVASQTGDTLTLNIGPNAASRLQGDTSDFGETIFVASSGSDIKVWGSDFDRDTIAEAMTFSGVSKIVGDGGAGADTIDLTGLTLTGVAVEIHGGEGDDVIRGGEGIDLLFGDGGDDDLYGGDGADVLRGGIGDDELFGEAGTDSLFGEDGDDSLDGGAETDLLDGGRGNDTFTRSAGGDTYDLGNFGSVDVIDGSSLGDTLDFTGAGQNLTFFLDRFAGDLQIHVGYNLLAGEDGNEITDFASQLIVTDAAGITNILGGSGTDLFLVRETASGLTLNGGNGSDRYVFHADPTGAKPIDVTVADVGNGLGTNLIEAIGGGTADTIAVTNGMVTLNAVPNQTVTYVAPTDLVTQDKLEIKVRSGGGDDDISVASTNVTVPVRIETGADDDVVTVGDGSLDAIAGTFLPGANAPFGFGPLVLVGGGGQDAVVLDDSADASGDFGNVTAFLEKRIGISELIEVGVVTGLGMTMQDGLTSRDGRVEYEGFEAVEVKLGGGDDVLTVGGAFDLDKASPTGGEPAPEMLVDTLFPKARLSDDVGDPNALGIKQIVHAISGMTILSAGGGDDTVNVLATNALDRATLDGALDLVGVATAIQGGGTDPERQTVTIDGDAHGIGYFTLQYRFEETRPIRFGASAAEVQQALVDLFLIGQDALSNDNVSVSKSVVGGDDVYEIEFVNGLDGQDVAQLVARIVPLLITGAAGVDHVSVQSLTQDAFLLGGDGEDFFDLNVDLTGATTTTPIPDPLPALTANGINAVLTLDGQGDGDDYEVNLIGGATDSRMSLFDSGTSGFDRLTLYGTETPDLFLLRAASSESGLAFVALLNEDAGKGPTEQPYERLNYDNKLEEIIVEGRGGDDAFHVDDTRASITINAGEGDDFFQIGQLFKTRRTPALAGVLPEDVFTTIETTVGWLSNGISETMTANGDAGEDEFIVFHNLAALSLNGGADDDRFIVKAFALAGSQEDLRGQTDLSGDAGADLIEYAVNAPVNINGGDGLDTVIVIGTEFGDDFVVTKDGVFGAGLNVNFINIEFLEVDAAEGDDRFFIQSTDDEFVARITGGLGTDFFWVNGPTPRNGVISNDLLGHSGIITHSATSTDLASLYEGLKIVGISANVADNDEPMIVLTETDGFTRVIEGAALDQGGMDTYAVVLARPPRDDGAAPAEDVRVTIAPPKGLVLLDGALAEIRNAEGDAVGVDLIFDASNWYVPQIVRLAVDTTIGTTPDLVDVQHKIEADDTITGTVGAGSVNGEFYADSDGFEALLVDASGLNFGDPAAFPDLPEGLRGRYVTIVDCASDPEAVGQTRLILDVDASGALILNKPWTVEPPSDAKYEIQLYASSQIPNVKVEVFTNERPAIVVDEIAGAETHSLATGGSTSVAEGADTAGGDAIDQSGADFIRVRLSAQPSGDVTVALDSSLLGTGKQLRFLDASDNPITSLTFTNASWDDFQTVKVLAVDDGVVEGFHKSDLILTATSGDSAFDGLSSSLVVDIADNERPGVRIIESGGRTNVVEFTDGRFGVSAAVADAAGFPRADSYQVVLSQQPAAGETVTVHLLSEPTRTSRTGGIRSYIEQVELSTDGVNFFETLTLTFDSGNWDQPQTVHVQAKEDQRVDGGDTKVFAPGLDQLDSIQGPLFIVGGLGEDRTGLLEAEPVMLPYETNIKDGIGTVVAAADGDPATATIDLDADADIAEFLALTGKASLSDLTAADFVDLSLEITEGPAKNKVRIVTAASVVDQSAGIWSLTLKSSWYSPFSDDSSVPTGDSRFTLFETNPNLLVDEVDQADRLMVFDGDNVNSFDDPALGGGVNQFAVGRLFYDDVNLYGDPGKPLDRFRITGLGMAGDRQIGGFTQPGGIILEEMEEIEVNLGPGNNRFTIDDTPVAHLTLNTGGGDDEVRVKAVSGHTIVNLGAGDDTITVANDDQSLQDLLGLLTVTGDVPQALVETLAKGSPAEGPSVNAVDEIQRLAIEATGGSFVLSLDGHQTAALAHDVSGDDLRVALEGLVGAAYAVDGIGDVAVTKAGGTYRITFLGDLAGQDIAQLAADGSGLTNGLGTHDVLTIDGSGWHEHGVGVLTSTSLTGLGMPQVNAIQTLVLNATGGSFRLGYGGQQTAALAHDVSAAGLETALVDLAGIEPGDVAVTRNDDVWVIRFQGNLGNQAIAPLTVAANDLTLDVETGGGAVASGPGEIAVTARVDGTDTPAVNDMQVLTVHGSGGSYTLSLLGGAVVTDPIAHEASAETVRDALQRALAGGDPFAALKFDVSVDKIGNVYLVGFQGKLRQIADGPGVDLLQVGGDGGVTVTTRMDGINYYGFETVELSVGDGDAVLNIQGATAGSGGFAEAGGVAATNIGLAGGDEQVFIASNADLDFASAPGFDFLTGGLDDVNGALNLDFGDGRHALMISDEANTTGRTVAITDTLPGDAAARRLAADAEIWITGLSGTAGLPDGGISYRAAATGNLFDGVVYWTGAGDDTVTIDGTHLRAGERTMTLLNTGLGGDEVAIDLDLGEDGFFALHASGGSASPAPTAGVVDDDDLVRAADSTLPLILFGGYGADDIEGGQARDVVFGDFGRVQYGAAEGALPTAAVGFGGRGDRIDSAIVEPAWIISRDLTLGGEDIVQGHEQEDILIGGAAGDSIDGDAGDDLIFGDAVRLERRAGDITNPRFQTLLGSVIYGRSDLTEAAMGAPVPLADQSGQALVDGIWRDWRNQGGGAPQWAAFEIVELYHSDDIATGLSLAGSFGDDYIAGGAANDMIFAQLGDDVVQGDGAIEGALAGTPVGAERVAAPDIALTPTLTVPTIGTLSVTASFEAATDGDDYIEGNGGDDVVFGNLGQDDIVGGSSGLFSLTGADLRPDGSDMLFGGAGLRIERDAAVTTANADTIVPAEAHARDADTMIGDNGNIIRLVGTEGVDGGGFLQFVYDDYSSLKIVPRAVVALDYTAGGPDYSAAALDDIGGADEIHGESGDDTVYGLRGDDVLFGDGEDDDLIGGWGHEWISAGTGIDGVLGDDGRIMTSRNGNLGEPLHGIAGLANNEMDVTISTPGKIQTAVINPAGALKKTVDLTPFYATPAGDPLTDASHHDDVIFGGLGGDFLHGGVGDDAISGAEALAAYFDRPANPGNVLRHDPVTGEFADYDEYAPMTKLVPFLLNFDADAGPLVPGATVHSDGADVIFGDLGNDWLVGGTDRDTLWGGHGADLLNADDDLDTNGGLNDAPDGPEASYEDRAYGGAGRDVLIANTGGDRLIDWVGEFNSFVVPFAPYGNFAISRTVQPQLYDFLYALSEAQGADPTRATDTGADPARNGEPRGEIGLVTQSDPEWQDQTGAPADPQAGNIPGGPRDVLRSASFDDGTSSGFTADSGTWEVRQGRLTVAPTTLGEDAVSVWHIDTYVPNYFEIRTAVSAAKDRAGYDSNAYVIFDYQSPTDFKFAGIDAKIDKLQIGHRTAEGWIVDVQSPSRLRHDTLYDVLVAINGTAVTLVVDGRDVLSHAFAPRVVDGIAYGFKDGMIGIGADNSFSTIDRMALQVLPPQLTFEHVEDLTDGASWLLGGASGDWSFAADGLVGTPSGAAPALRLVDLGMALGLAPDSFHLDQLSVLDLSATIQAGGLAGLMFDHYGPERFKFAAIDPAGDTVMLGHYSPRDGWEIDAQLSTAIPDARDHELGLLIKGSTVSVTLNGNVVLSHAYNALVTDGGFGLIARDAPATFGGFAVKTDDPAFLDQAMAALVFDGPVGAGGATIDAAAVDSLRLAAVERLQLAYGLDPETTAGLQTLTPSIADLPGNRLGMVRDGNLYLDHDAAGHGWFVDPTPEDDDEFRRPIAPGLLGATDGEARKGVDALTVLMHEFGHVIGLEHGETPLMQDSLSAGVRAVPAAEPAPTGTAKIFEERIDAFVGEQDRKLLNWMARSGLLAPSLDPRLADAEDTLAGDDDRKVKAFEHRGSGAASSSDRSGKPEKGTGTAAPDGTSLLGRKLIDWNASQL